MLPRIVDISYKKTVQQELHRLGLTYSPKIENFQNALGTYPTIFKKEEILSFITFIKQWLWLSKETIHFLRCVAWH